MKIALDSKHFLNSDAYSYWITCSVAYKGKDGKEKTSERRVSGYMSTFADAVNSFIEKKLKSSEAAELEQLKKEIQKLKREVREWKIDLEGEK